MAVFSCIAIRILYNPMTKEIKLVDFDNPNVSMNTARVAPGTSVVWQLDEALDTTYSVEISFQPRRGFERVFSPFPVQKLSFSRTSMAMPAMFLETRYKYSVTILKRNRVLATLDPEIEPTGTGGYSLALLQASSAGLISFDPGSAPASPPNVTITVTRTGESYVFQQAPTGAIPKGSWVAWKGSKDGNDADLAIVFGGQTPFVDGYGNPINTIYSSDGAYQVFIGAPSGRYPYTAETINSNGELETPASAPQDLVVA